MTAATGGTGSTNGSRTASALQLEWCLPAPPTTVLDAAVFTIVSRMYGCGSLGPNADVSLGTGLIDIPLADDVET